MTLDGWLDTSLLESPASDPDTEPWHAWHDAVMQRITAIGSGARIHQYGITIDLLHVLFAPPATLSIAYLLLYKHGELIPARAMVTVQPGQLPVATAYIEEHFAYHQTETDEYSVHRIRAQCAAETARHRS